jgi:hypothetical protein
LAPKALASAMGHAAKPRFAAIVSQALHNKNGSTAISPRRVFQQRVQSKLSYP